MNRKFLLLLSISIIIALAISEFLLRIFFPIDDPYRDFKTYKYGYIYSEYPKDFQITTQTEEGLPGMEPKLRNFSTNYYTFRGDLLSNPKPDNEFRIIAIGGSTTENFYLDDTETWTRVLQDNLGPSYKNISTKVYAAAKSGDRIDNHIAMLSQRAIHLQPDMIILLVGANDMLTNATGYDPYHFPAEVKLGSGRILKLFLTEFQIPRYVYKVVEFLKGTSKDKELLSNVPIKSNFKEKVTFAKNAPEGSEEPPFKSQPYKEDLESFIGIAKLNKVPVLLITQATSWNSKVDSKCNDWHWLLYRNGKYYREDIMEHSMELVNNITKEVGQQENMPVYDLAKNMPKTLEYFFDDVHFNVKGARKFGEDLARFIVYKKLIY